jgi:hypothetical protein
VDLLLLGVVALWGDGDGDFEAEGLGRPSSASLLIFFVFSLLVGVDAARFLLARGRFAGVAPSSCFSKTSLVELVAPLLRVDRVACLVLRAVSRVVRDIVTLSTQLVVASQVDLVWVLWFQETVPISEFITSIVVPKAATAPAKYSDVPTSASRTTRTLHIEPLTSRS